MKIDGPTSWALGHDYLGQRKAEDGLNEWAVEHGIPAAKVKANLWQMPAEVVGPYAEMDATLALKIFAKQLPLLKEQELWKVFELETALVDLLLDMRFQGIPVDLDRADEVRKRLEAEEAAAQNRLDSLAGQAVDVWSGDDIKKACDRLGLQYPMTAKGNPSFEAEWLEAQETPFFQGVLRVRRLNRGGGVFIQKKILEMQHRGRVHPSFMQSRDDDGGTVSGRFASKLPNMQQVPARDPVLAPLIRSIYRPLPGALWMVGDYSQQEPRVTVHYAYLSGFRGSDEARRRYTENPDTDYHQMVAEMAHIPRKDAKAMNLGLAYGMGKAKMALDLGRSMKEVTELYDQYHASVPFVKLLGDKCTRVAQDRGYIRTLLGRRRHFELWGPTKYSSGVRPLPRLDAIQEFGYPITRWFVHKAMNALVQGSSADMVKAAMVELHKAGDIPHITIHDELDLSVADEAHARRVRQAMLDCVKLEVPLKVDVELGPSWGEAKEVNLG
jgi:DNA polymerase I-like protein with 3'-5' exonuclease and polymerase domains